MGFEIKVYLIPSIVSRLFSGKKLSESNAFSILEAVLHTRKEYVSQFMLRKYYENIQEWWFILLIPKVRKFNFLISAVQHTAFVASLFFVFYKMASHQNKLETRFLVCILRYVPLKLTFKQQVISDCLTETYNLLYNLNANNFTSQELIHPISCFSGNTVNPCF